MEYNVKMYENLIKVHAKTLELENELTISDLKLNRMTEINKQLKGTEKLIKAYLIYRKLIIESQEAEELLATSDDNEIVQFAKEVISNVKNEIPKIENQLKILLLPKDPNDDKNIIVEMRPAAGGDEASIFVYNLFDTYKRYCEKQKWTINILDLQTQPHGYDYISFSVSGVDVYSKMKFESGVHRVQRVPATESKGRVHTSTITVAILPEQDELEIKIVKSDLREDTYRASGAGGQHVNRTESAVRLTHLPTGIVAACQEGKSQFSNRDTAMKMLRAKIWEFEEGKRNKEYSDQRKSQVGSGERSEKIRTYNYPQNRITDHRINLTLNKLDYIMQGGCLEEIIDPLISNEQTELMTTFKI